MASSEESFDQSNQAGMGFLFTELDAAMTFLSLAGITRNEVTAQRNRDNARLAYESVLRYMGRVRFSDEKQKPFDLKLAEVRTAL